MPAYIEGPSSFSSLSTTKCHTYFKVISPDMGRPREANKKAAGSRGNYIRLYCTILCGGPVSAYWGIHQVWFIFFFVHPRLGLLTSVSCQDRDHLEVDNEAWKKSWQIECENFKNCFYKFIYDTKILTATLVTYPSSLNYSRIFHVPKHWLIALYNLSMSVRM